MSNTQITIESVKNIGTQDISICFTRGMGDLTVMLPANAETSMIPITLNESEILHFTVQLSAGTIRPLQAELMFAAESSGNQFSLCVHGFTGGPVYKPIQSPTTPNKPVQLSVKYEGDGVVVVGTGDL